MIKCVYGGIHFMIGVYKITNILNDDCYIGSTLDINKRWKQHMSRYNKRQYKSYDLPLYKAMREFGIANFKFEVLELCDENFLIQTEQKYFDIYKPYYNKRQPKDCLQMISVKDKIRLSMQQSFNNYSDEKKEKIYKNLKKGKDTIEYQKQKYCPKKIMAIKILDGTKLYFDSLYQAEKELNIPRSSICQILNINHQRKQAKGYTFQYI